MTPLLASALVLGLQAWALPHAGKAFIQNELTYFHDCAIVSVGLGAAEPQVREVRTPVGPLEAKCRTQSAKVVSSNFGLEGALTLVFTPRFPQTQPAPRPGWIELPLPPGNYFVMGRRSRNGVLLAFPGITAYGFRDKNAYPSVTLVQVPSGSDREFAVFHILPTNQASLASGSTEAASVLRNMVGALAQCQGPGFEETVSLLLRTDHERYPELKGASSLAALDLARCAQTSTGTRRALAYLGAYKMSSTSRQVELEAAVFEALAASGTEDGAFWQGQLGRQALDMFQPAIFPSPAEAARLVGWERQSLVLDSYTKTESEIVRRVFARFLSGGFSAKMHPAIIRALRATEPESKSAEELLDQIATWMKDPDRKPAAKLYTPESLVAYWLEKLGG